MHKLIEYACDKLEELEKKAAKGDLSMAETEYAEILSSLKKNLLKGEILSEEMESGEYSGTSYARGGNRGGENPNRGGSYARGRGRNARRDSMGRYSGEQGYSRSDEMDELVSTIRESMDDMPESVKRDAMRFVQKLEDQSRMM